MTVDEYYAAVRALGWRPSKIKGVWLDADGCPHSVPDPEKHTMSQRATLIDIMRSGVSFG